MNESTRIALIPVYQPGAVLPGLVRELEQCGFTVVVVDDGSGAAYDSVLACLSPAATLLRHERNRGKGAALKTGLVHIGRGFAPPFTVVSVDGDGQHCPADALAVCLAAQAHPDSLILGSRRLRGDVPLRSLLGNTVTRWVCRLAGGARVYDTQTGLRGFSNRLLPRLLDVPGSRYEYEMNMLLALGRERRDIREVRIQTVYENGNRCSHFRTLRDSVRIYREILAFGLFGGEGQSHD